MCSFSFGGSKSWSYFPETCQRLALLFCASWSRARSSRAWAGIGRVFGFFPKTTQKAMYRSWATPWSFLDAPLTLCTTALPWVCDAPVFFFFKFQVVSHISVWILHMTLMMLQEVKLSGGATSETVISLNLFLWHLTCLTLVWPWCHLVPSHQ